MWQAGESVADHYVWRIVSFPEGETPGVVTYGIILGNQKGAHKSAGGRTKSAGMYKNIPTERTRKKYVSCKKYVANALYLVLWEFP